MKNYLKFIVAVFGISVATFGSINLNAKPKPQEPDCPKGFDVCKLTAAGETVFGPLPY
jgi:hypothetical protein